MNVLDLFSGIGGFSLGLERAGMRTVAFCEIEPYCRAVLRKHWPDVPIFEDVRTLTAADVQGINLICGGFPCQPFSRAGKRLGEKDNRSLWHEYFRLIKELRPTWVIGENTIGFVDLGLDAAIDDLESASYSTRTFDIPACAVGAAHERRRIWIVAHANGNGYKERINVGCTVGNQAASEQPGSQDIGIPATSDAANPERWEQSLEWQIRRTWRQGESVSRNGDWAFEIEPCLGRGDDGIPQRLDRLKALGNAVVPQIPEIIGRAIMSIQP